MNSTEIRSILRSPYNRENWKNLYRNIFQNKVTFHEEPYQYNVNEDIVESLFQIGYATLDDEYIVALFEVNIKIDVNLLSKKIGLRKIISKYISDDKFNGVLTIFENGSPDYRFTFASKTTKITEEGIEVFETESKRFTYILGENEPCLTPTQRFESLFKKNGKINLDDIKEAFSVDKLNKEFFNGYKEHYETLCNFFYSSSQKKKFFNDDEKSIRDFVKKFLGRIVFLYFVQKKGWLGVKKGANWGTGDPMFLSNLFKSYKNKNEFYNKVISKIFFDYLSIERKDDTVNLFEDKIYRIPYLNGGLFEKEDIDEFEINFEQSFLDSLFSFFDRFNFTIYEDDPNEHTVAVDPEMLGHIFENLLEDNKDKGAFYTPKEIVHYMCQESLIEYLTTWFENKGYEIVGYSSFDNPEQAGMFSENEGRKGQLVLENKLKNSSKKIDRILIEKLLKKKLSDNDRNLIIEHSNEFHIALDEVKICDPAIGSGAFPMGLLQEIYISKQTLWIFEHGNLDNFPASDIKLNIIQNSIYGVDIEKGAVDIARLRFWLSLIVDEDEPKSLPNLDYKIVVGNSLISLFENEIIDIDWNIEFKNLQSVSKIILNQQNKIYQLDHAQHLYFQSYTNKGSLKNQIKTFKIEILQNQLLLTKISFSENNPILGGFMPTEKEVGINTYNKTFTEKIDFLISKLEEIKNNKMLNLNYFDWRLNFPEVLNNKINDKSGFDIVIGNPPYGSNIDNYATYYQNKFIKVAKSYLDIYKCFYEQAFTLIKPRGIVTLITPNTFISQPRYKDIRTFLLGTSILKINNLGMNVFESAVVPTLIFIGSKSEPFEQFIYIDSSKNSKFDSLIDKDETSLIKRQDIESSKDISFLNFKSTHKLTFDDVFEIKDAGIQYHRSGIGLKNKGGNDLYERLFSDNKNHFKNNIPTLYGKKINYYHIDKIIDEYFNLDYKKDLKLNESVSFSLEAFNRKPKIIWRQTASKPIATIDYNGTWFRNTIQCCWIKNEYNNISIEFCLGLINSRFISYTYNRIVSEAGRVFPQVKIGQLKKLPFVIPDLVTSEFILCRVKRLLNEDLVPLNAHLLIEIDIAIYKLYNLSYNEIKEVDTEFKLSEQEYIEFKID
jgi:adenine-specific DNA-methyltransferase